jgi:ABC-type sugar transport system ATPase subunit
LLDEATSALGPEESASLFRLVRSLRDSGKGIIFISHRMEEIDEIADRMTILKDGETVGHLVRNEFDRSRVFRLMLGDSTEHEELVALCDRVLVFRDGRISGELEGDQLTHDKRFGTLFRKSSAA